MDEDLPARMADLASTLQRDRDDRVRDVLGWGHGQDQRRDELAGFLADIVERPADDTPRLVFADWCEDNGEAERAEFIRLQIELARYEAAIATRGTTFPAPPMPDGFLSSTQVVALRRRELELFRSNQDWLAPLASAFGVPVGDRWHIINNTDAWVRLDGGAEVIATFRRGFVALVRLPLAAWVGEVCGRCGGCGWDSIPERTRAKPNCSVCHGTGRTGAHGPALVRAHPLERVEVADRKPSYRGHWFDASVWANNEGRDNLPHELFVLLTGGRHAESNASRIYKSPELATAALSAALTLWAHSHQPPLL